MKLFHSSSCKGPPQGCNKGYILIAIILSLFSTLGILLARSASSNAAQIDAMHTSVHGLFYGSILYLAFKTRKQKFTEHHEFRIRLRYARMNVWGMLLFLTYIVFWEALPRMWTPVVVVGWLMTLGVSLGFIGLTLETTILWLMRKGHEGAAINQECDRGRRATHRTAFLHVIWDASLSFAALFAAIIIWLDPGKSIIDPILTFAATPFILLQTYFVLKSFKRDEAQHHGHSHTH